MAAELSAEISAVRNIICEGPGAYFVTKSVGSGGWLVLSEDALEGAMKALNDAYWIAKEKNKKYGRRKSKEVPQD